jgi:hypothetical protein
MKIAPSVLISANANQGFCRPRGRGPEYPDSVRRYGQGTPRATIILYCKLLKKARQGRSHRPRLRHTTNSSRTGCDQTRDPNRPSYRLISHSGCLRIGPLRTRARAVFAVGTLVTNCVFWRSLCDGGSNRFRRGHPALRSSEPMQWARVFLL